MQNNLRLNMMILGYMLLLVVLVIFNMIREVSFLDIIYLISLLCCILKYFMIVFENRKQ